MTSAQPRVRWGPRLLAAVMACLLVGCIAVPVNVHLIAHSHDDVGWLFSEDQYYTGENPIGERGCVRCILDAVVPELLANSSRKFVYVEMAFFSRWWAEQSAERQDDVRQLVTRGQLQFAGGGWCMNDEATPTYDDIITQMTAGHEWLRDTFGSDVRVRTGWQIDPFGHSGVQAGLFADMGFNSFFFSRLHHREQQRRRERKELQFVWQGSMSRGSDAELLTAIMYDGYCAPPQVSPRRNAFHQPVSDLSDEQLLAAVRDAVDKRRAVYATNDIMFTQGCDFEYYDAPRWFKLMDRIIALSNADFRAFYSTPDEYVTALKAGGHRWSLLRGHDFFPYADHPHAYWTGYFTSRPRLKQSVRAASSLLFTARLVDALLPDEADDANRNLTVALSVAQHHDAVSGTARNVAVDDYARQLFLGGQAAAQGVAKRLTRLLSSAAAASGAPGSGSSGGTGGGVDALRFSYCASRNESACAATADIDGGRLLMLVNSRTQDANDYVTVPVNSAAITVVDADGHAVDCQVTQVSPFVQRLGNEETTSYELLFRASVPALGIAGYRLLSATAASAAGLPRCGKAAVYTGAHALHNEQLKLRLDARGLPQSLQRGDHPPTAFVQSLMRYDSIDTLQSDVDGDDAQMGGPYIFRPASTMPQPLASAVGPPLSVLFSLRWTSVLLLMFCLSGCHWLASSPAASRSAMFVQVARCMLLFSAVAAVGGLVASVPALASPPIAGGSFLLTIVAALASITSALCTRLPRAKTSKRGCRPPDDTPSCHVFAGELLLAGLLAAQLLCSWRLMRGSGAPSLPSWTLRGPLMQEVRVQYSNRLQQTVRVYKGEPWVEFDYMIGVLPIFRDGRPIAGLDVLTRYSTAVPSNSRWLADMNGKEIRTYKRGDDAAEPVASNVYPTTSFAGLHGGDEQLFVWLDRSEGVSSMADGQLDVFLHRSFTNDDGRGMGEVLVDVSVIRVRHRVSLGKHGPLPAAIREGMQDASRPLQLWVSPLPDAWQDGQLALPYLRTSLLAGADVPPGLRIQTLRRWTNSSLLLRLEHAFERGDGPLAAPISLTVAQLFPAGSAVRFSSVRELSLTGYELDSDARADQLRWPQQPPSAPRQSQHPGDLPVTSLAQTFRLQPMQIRTLQLFL